MTEPTQPAPTPAPSAAQRIQDSLDRAQHVPHHDGPIEPRDAGREHIDHLTALNAALLTDNDNLDHPADAPHAAPIRVSHEHHAALIGTLAAALPGAATNLDDGRDLAALAAALARARSAGYDLDAHLPSLITQAPLPVGHPLRELHYRLLIDCPEALPATGSSPRPKPLPPGSRVDEAGVDDHAFYLVTTRGGQVVGAGHDRGQAEHLAHTHAAARNRPRH